MAASTEHVAGEGGPESGIGEETYWSRLKARGISPIRRQNEKRWMCRRIRDGDVEFPIYIDDPGWMTPEQRLAALDEYLRRYAWFDC